MEYPKRKYDGTNEIHKGFIRFIRLLRENPGLFDVKGMTLRDRICAAMMCELLNKLGVKKANQIGEARGDLMIDMSVVPQIDSNGELIEVKWGESRFKITIRNSKG